MFKLALKRKRAGKVASDYSDESTGSDQALSDNEIDISSALTSKRARITAVADEHDSDDDDLRNFLQESISRRDIKAGTEIVKKTKGKGKVAKGEVGGGSFQSMGQSMLSTLSRAKETDPKQ
jgi:ATP-dependent RNA helicase DDX54/DBP10